MSDINTWMALRSAMQADEATRRPVDRKTVGRVVDFARPHGRTITSFLALATVPAVLGVASPVVAGQAVDAIVAHEPAATVIGLGLVIALLALMDAGVSFLARLQS